MIEAWPLHLVQPCKGHSSRPPRYFKFSLSSWILRYSSHLFPPIFVCLLSLGLQLEVNKFEEGSRHETEPPGRRAACCILRRKRHNDCKKICPLAGRRFSLRSRPEGHWASRQMEPPTRRLRLITFLPNLFFSFKLCSFGLTRAMRLRYRVTTNERQLFPVRCGPHLYRRQSLPVVRLDEPQRSMDCDKSPHLTHTQRRRSDQISFCDCTRVGIHKDAI